MKPFKFIVFLKKENSNQELKIKKCRADQPCYKLNIRIPKILTS